MARLLRQQDDSGYAPALLTALAVVDREGPLTLGALAAQEQVSPPTITKVVDTLERHGFVERIRDEHDRRVWRVKATTRGKRQLERSRTRRTEWLANQLRGVTEQDRAQIMAALDVLEQFTAVPPLRGAMKALSRFSNETFSSLRIRNFRLFFCGQMISQVGNWLTLITQTLLVLHLTGNGVAVGLLTACQFAPGAPVRRVGRAHRRPLRQAEAAHHRAVLRDGAVVRAGRPRVHGPPAARRDLRDRVRGRLSRSRSTTRPAARSSSRWCPRTTCNNAVAPQQRADDLVADHRPGARRPADRGRRLRWAFALDGLSYIAVIVGLWMMNPAQLRRSPVAERGKGQVRAGLAYARRQPELWIPLVMMAIVGTLAFNFQVVMPLLVQRTFHGGDATFTVLFSVISIGSLIGALSTARRKEITIRHIIVASTAFGVTMLALVAHAEPRARRSRWAWRWVGRASPS